VLGLVLETFPSRQQNGWRQARLAAGPASVSLVSREAVSMSTHSPLRAARTMTSNRSSSS
jgi:hypothetical protein